MQPKLVVETSAEPRIQLQESRRALRQLARRVILTGISEDHRPFHATLHDLSRRGMRIRMEDRIHCGQFVKLEAEQEAGIEAIECRVVRIQAIDSAGHEMFEYGLQISDDSRAQGHQWFLHFCYGGAPPARGTVTIELLTRET